MTSFLLHRFAFPTTLALILHWAKKNYSFDPCRILRRHYRVSPLLPQPFLLSLTDEFCLDCLTSQFKYSFFYIYQSFLSSILSPLSLLPRLSDSSHFGLFYSHFSYLPCHCSASSLLLSPPFLQSPPSPSPLTHSWFLHGGRGYGRRGWLRRQILYGWRGRRSGLQITWLLSSEELALTANFNAITKETGKTDWKDRGFSRLSRKV